MTIIGVDSSGHVGQPPIYFIAVRHSAQRGQVESLVYVSPEKHRNYEELVSNLRVTNWKDKVSAILIFKAVCGLFQSNDAINIDVDFQGRSRRYVEEYLKKLFARSFPKNAGRNNPNITFVPARINNYVNQAHKKSKKARYKRIPINYSDPQILHEIDLLK